MNIVHVITRLIVGGAQENTILSCLGQSQLGHRVTLVTGPALGPEGSLIERAQTEGYDIVLIDEMRRAILPYKDFVTYRKLVNLFKELKPDIVHTHSSKAGIIGRYAAAKANVPAIIHTIHGLAFTASTNPLVNNVYKYLERKAARKSTAIVCVADAMRDQSLAANIGAKEQYHTVYSGMDIEPFLNPPVPRETVRQSLNISPDHVVVGTIARLFDLKGHEDLIALAPELCAKFPNLRFLWVGDGSLRQMYEAQIREKGLTDRFILTGLVPPARIPELCNAMDIVVHPSRREGLARAIAQGQLAGCPAIAYDIDGNREGLLHGDTGFIVPPFEVQKLRENLLALLENPQKSREMGQKGRTFAKERFSTQTMVRDLEKVYQIALGQTPNPKSQI